jgi:hypothetical protein
MSIRKMRPIQFAEVENLVQLAFHEESGICQNNRSKGFQPTSERESLSTRHSQRTRLIQSAEVHNPIQTAPREGTYNLQSSHSKETHLILEQ